MGKKVQNIEDNALNNGIIVQNHFDLTGEEGDERILVKIIEWLL